MEEGTSHQFPNDSKKRIILNELKKSFDPSKIDNDSTLARRFIQLSTEIGRLGKSAQTTSDISFAVNIADYATDCVATHLENNDPNRELFHDLTIADEESMASWCPRMYAQLEELTRSCIPARISFQKRLTLKDLMGREDIQKPAKPDRERKPRFPRKNDQDTVRPQKIITTEASQSHETNMERALNILLKISENQPMPFYKFVLHPTSFVQTVYNIFIVSFIVHERHALLRVGKNYELFIEPCTLTDSEDITEYENAPSIQLIQSLSPYEWNALVKHWNLDSPILPEFCPKQSKYFQDNDLCSELSSNVTFLEP